MPTITVGQQQDMAALDRDLFQDVLSGGELILTQPDSVTYQRVAGDPSSGRVTFSGTGFGAPGPDGFPTTGTITEILVEDGGQALVFQLANLAVPVADFLAALQSGDPQVFIDLLFGDGATINGAYAPGVGEILHGHGGDDTISGNDGQDLIHGGDGNDTVYGGDETGPTSALSGDAIDGGNGDDNLFGGGSRDTLIGGFGSDSLDGGDGDDLIIDGATDISARVSQTFILPDFHDIRVQFPYERNAPDQDVDVINGGAGNDIVTVGLGDTVDGGDGIDRVEVDFRFYGTGLALDLAVGQVPNVIGSASGGFYVNVELFTVRGSTFNDYLAGTGASDTFLGGGGGDILLGRDGADRLFGGADPLNAIIGGQPGYAFDDGVRDDLDGGEGNDAVSVGVLDVANGGNGTDTLNITLVGLSQGVNLDLQTGDRFATLSLAAGGLFEGFENISYIATTDFNDVLRVAHSGNFYTLGGDDVFHGNDLVQFVGGNGGNDVINAYGGADRVWGGDGDDELHGGAGDDVLTADEDNLGAFVVPYAGNDVLDGGDGNDQLIGGGGADLLIGGAGADFGLGGEGFDTVSYAGASSAVTVTIGASAGDGRTQLTGSAGDADGDGFFEIERVIGSDWGDSLSAAGLDDGVGVNLAGAGGADTINGSETHDLLDGGADNDLLFGRNGDDILRGGAGVDILNGGAGSDTADYTTAAAGMRAQLNTNASSNDGDGGTDTFSSIENLTGSAFNDVLIGDNNVNILRGGLGADTLLGLGGNDVLWGGSGAANTLQGGLGDDRYVIEAGDSVIENAGEGIDTVEARIAAYALSANVENLVFGGTGNFAGTGNADANTITGGAGDDNLRGRGGVDILNGGDGVDTVDYTLAAAGVTARLDLNRATNDGDGATDTFTGVENLTGSNFNDLLIGDGNANVLMGGIGTDTLLGFGGDDVLMGGSGGGNNQLQGGTGNDWYVLDAFDTVVELANEGIDTVEARIGSYTMGANIENLLYTGPGKFVGSGNVLDNTITGGAQNDILKGGGGNDTINGGDGADEVQLRGSAAEYTVTVDGAGYRIVDTVADRDGSTFVDSIEVLRFLTGNTTRALSYPPPDQAPVEPGDKDVGALTSPIIDDQPIVLPALHDKAFEEPLTLPGQDEGGLSLRELFALHNGGHPGSHILFAEPDWIPVTTDRHDWM